MEKVQEIHEGVTNWRMGKEGEIDWEGWRTRDNKEEKKLCLKKIGVTEYMGKKGVWNGWGGWRNGFEREGGREGKCVERWR